MEGRQKLQAAIQTLDPTGDAADRVAADAFAGRVKEQLMQGRASWQKAREPGEQVLPRSLRTGQMYTGYNSVYLSTTAEERGFRDVCWGTREQIETMGGRIREDERPEVLTGVVETNPRGLRIDMGGDSLTLRNSDDLARTALVEARSRPVEPKTVYRVGFVAKDGTAAWSSAGWNKEEADRLAGEYLKSGRVPSDALPGASYSAVTRVYNAEQADGLPPPEHSRSEPLWKAHQRAEDILRSAGTGVRHTDGGAVSYSVERDEIKIPKKERFASATDYYRTVIKQLCHAAVPRQQRGALYRAVPDKTQPGWRIENTNNPGEQLPPYARGRFRNILDVNQALKQLNEDLRRRAQGFEPVKYRVAPVPHREGLYRVENAQDPSQPVHPYAQGVFRSHAEAGGAIVSLRAHEERERRRLATAPGAGVEKLPNFERTRALVTSAREELRAEMAASMTCERIGLGYKPQATVKPELKARALGSDNTELSQAASEAQKISDRLVAGGRDRAATREKNSPSPASPAPAQSPRFTPSLPQPKVAQPERTIQRSGGPSR